MSELLIEIRERAEARAEELQKDIHEARELIALYEAELTPLMAILKATSPKATPPTGTVEAVTEATKAAGGAARPLVYSKTTELPRHPHTGEMLNMGSSGAMLKMIKAIEKDRGVATSPAAPPQRWSQYKLPPRVRLFLSKFGNVKGQIRHQQIEDWYITVNPGIKPVSLKQAACDIATILITKGIMHREAPGVYSYASK